MAEEEKKDEPAAQELFDQEEEQLDPYEAAASLFADLNEAAAAEDLQLAKKKTKEI